MLNDIDESLRDGFSVVAENAPPGSGKSAVARCLQRQFTPTDIITSNNHLIGETYLKDYPLNAVMGKDHYATEDEYAAAHKLARTIPSIFNPLSYHFARERGLREPSMIVIDEAHLFVDMLTYLSAYVFPVSKTKIPENAKTEGDLIKWCYNRYDLLKKAISVPDAPGQLFQEFAKIARLRDTLLEGSQHQVFEISKAMIPIGGRRPQKCVVLTPTRVPSGLIKSVTNACRVVAMSGTMSQFDAEIIAAGRSLVYNQRQNLTPKERRPVHFDPVPQETRKDAQTLSIKIRNIYLANRVPTLVHVTYQQQNLLADLLQDLRPLTNTSQNKAKVKKKFVNDGGIWLAAGCAEGIDLPYSQCEQVIIPNVMFPDMGDPFVQKRMGLSDGQYWYKLRGVQNTIQRLYRGLRAADDKCVGHILDPAWSRVYPELQHEFAEINMIWGRK